MFLSVPLQTPGDMGTRRCQFVYRVAPGAYVSTKFDKFQLLYGPKGEADILFEWKTNYNEGEEAEIWSLVRRIYASVNWKKL